MKLTSTPPITVRSPDWDSDEYILLRTTKTTSDAEWIDEYSVKAAYDEKSANGVSVAVETNRMMQATIACLAKSWHLKRPQTDREGNVLYDGTEHNAPLMESIAYSTDRDERLQIVRSWHEDDVSFVMTELNKVLAKPKTAKEQQDFLTAATAPTPGNSDAVKPSQTPL